MMFFNPWKDYELKYENPMMKLRRSQLKRLEGVAYPDVMCVIFNSIPKNFRKEFMYEIDFDKAYDKCGNDFKKKLTACIKYCLEVIG